MTPSQMLAASTRCGQLVVGQQRQHAFEEPLLGAPDAGLAQGQRQRLAVVERVAHALERADVLGQRPVHQHRGLAFGLQAVEHAQRARHLAGEHGFAELEDVVARDVRARRPRSARSRARPAGTAAPASAAPGARPAGCLRRGRRRRPACCCPSSPVGDPLALARQALRQPGRQRAALDGLDAQRHAGGVERAEPAALLLLAVQPRQLHQGQHVVATSVSQ